MEVLQRCTFWLGQKISKWHQNWLLTPWRANTDIKKLGLSIRSSLPTSISCQAPAIEDGQPHEELPRPQQILDEMGRWLAQIKPPPYHRVMRQPILTKLTEMQSPLNKASRNKNVWRDGHLDISKRQISLQTIHIQIDFSEWFVRWSTW
jgi:hypothetical protein